MTEAIQTGSVIDLFFKNPETAEIVYDSLKPEELLPKASRAEIEIKVRENILSINVNARDTAALRATINSFLRWAAIARDMTKV